MKNKTITTTALYPDEGKWLTLSELDEGETRIFSTSVFCPSGHEDDWMEVDDEYKLNWEKAHPIPDLPEDEWSSESTI